MIPLVCVLALFAPSPAKTNAQKTNAQILTEAAEAVQSGRSSAILPLLEGLTDLAAPEQSRLVGLVAETMPMNLAMADRPVMLQAIRLARRKLPADPNLQLAEARTLETLGRHGEALAALAEAVTKATGPARDILVRMRENLSLVGKKAPAIQIDRTLGGFAGLDAWRGKVVLLDFFAHWCKPCAAAFPELKALYAENHDQGLELLGVTGYYGYIGAKKDLTPAQEFDAMVGFRQEKALPWPFAFAPNAVNETYRVMALPSTVVIDRHGVVRAVSFGYYPPESEALRTLVHQLISER